MRNNLPITQQEYIVPAGLTLVSKTDLQGTILECNDAFEAASGFSRSELIGKPHNLIRHPDVPEAVFADLWKTLKMGAPWSQVVKNRRADGGYYWVRANATPIFKNGEVSGYMSVRTAISNAEKQTATQAYQAISEGRAKIHHGKIYRGANWYSLNRFSQLNPQYQLSLLVLVFYLLPILGYASLHVQNLWILPAIALIGLIPPYWYGRIRLKTDRKLRRNLRQLASNHPIEEEFVNPCSYQGKLHSAFKSACLGALERTEESAYQLDKANQLQNAIDQLSANVMITDRELNILYLNQTMHTFLQQRQIQLKDALPSLNIDNPRGQNLTLFDAGGQLNLESLKNSSQAHSDIDLTLGDYQLHLHIIPVFNRAKQHTTNLIEWVDKTAEKQLLEQVNSTVEAARKGILNQRIDLSKVSGIALGLSESINTMLDAVETPINSVVDIARTLSNGDLTQRIEGNFEGPSGRPK